MKKRMLKDAIRAATTAEERSALASYQDPRVLQYADLVWLVAKASVNRPEFQESVSRQLYERAQRWDETFFDRLAKFLRLLKSIEAKKNRDGIHHLLFDLWVTDQPWSILQLEQQAKRWGIPATRLKLYRWAKAWGVPVVSPKGRRKKIVSPARKPALRCH